MAPWVFAAAYAAFERLQHIWADMAYRGQRLRAWVAEACGWTLEIVKPPRGGCWSLAMSNRRPVPPLQWRHAGGWWSARSPGLAAIAA
jgi:transposase